MPLDPVEYATKIHDTFKGNSLDKEEVTILLAGLDPYTLTKVKTTYVEKFGNLLILDVQKYVKGDFGKAIEGVLSDLDEYDADNLYKAMEGLGTNDKVLIEILTTRQPAKIAKIKEIFQKKYLKSLEHWIEKETSGLYTKFMLSLASGNRDGAAGEVNKQLVDEDVEKLHHKGGSKELYVDIFAARSWKHLRAVIKLYKEKYGDITVDLENCFGKLRNQDTKKALLATIQSIENKHGYFATLLNKSMVGAGTRDTDLIRILVSRRDIDLWEIAQEYKTIFGKELKEDIKGDTSGHYQKLLCQMVHDA